jgi:hypothetical protein
MPDGFAKRIQNGPGATSRALAAGLVRRVKSKSLRQAAMSNPEDKEFQTAVGILEDSRRLIAAGKVQR